MIGGISLGLPSPLADCASSLLRAILDGCRVPQRVRNLHCKLVEAIRQRYDDEVQSLPTKTGRSSFRYERRDDIHEGFETQGRSRRAD